MPVKQRRHIPQPSVRNFTVSMSCLPMKSLQAASSTLPARLEGGRFASLSATPPPSPQQVTCLKRMFRRTVRPSGVCSSRGGASHPFQKGNPTILGCVTADVMAGCMGGGTTVGVISTSVTAGYVVVVLLLVGGGGGGAAAASSP
eukprot:CAMPEP_0206120572 /NCGR_PEP_ID=MMETSP1472-20131121/700_1 /ASSEMBLY_ACC=CAM_ASM_001108 /TAXON_ID=41880 /ORGANISM="Pycnococcus provasolii, Strain RCC251" /LENGTH=144 /DNA_ID=CAMNT_0053510729 /DNA_START=1128 /DNA_END=1562 /DNA_ORIENTATION=-